MPTARAVVPLLLAASVALPCIGGLLEDEVDLERHWLPGWRELAAFGDGGFVVWESNRTGRWRIWRRELDGSGLRQLTPDTPGLDHFCPHLSPDGTRLAYLTMPAGQDCYTSLEGAGELRLIGTDGAGDRSIAAAARPYFEDRAALWIDDTRLFFIDADGVTHELDVDRGERTRRSRNAAPDYGWLPNATRTHATNGWPMFPPYDPDTGRILFRTRLPGCQPYFSRDGRWGFFTSGSGGPIERYELATRTRSVIVEQRDERLPESRRYFYFPMISACQHALAFAASFFEHHHFTADYDVFVARVDPFTLEMQGAPLRYTFDPGCDRFPDVHVRAQRLGLHRGVAPLVVDLAEALDGRWRVDFGDGTPPGTATAHTYPVPGRYRVVAMRGEEVRDGLVQVEATADVAPARVARWPFEADSLVFAIETAAADNLAREHGSGNEIAFPIEPDGTARFDRRFALRLDGGSFASTSGGANVTAACSAAQQFTFSGFVEPATDDQDGVIASLTNDAGVVLFTLAQRGTRYQARLHAAAPIVLDLGVAKPRSLTFGSDPERGLVARADGEFVARDAGTPAFGVWRGGALRLGDGAWRGAIHHVAVFAGDRQLEQVVRDHELARAWADAVPPIESRAVRGILVEKSTLPTLEEIKPYRDALAVFEYESDGARYRVAHRTILNGADLPVSERRIGDVHELVLEPFEAHPECAALFKKDTLAEDFDAVLWFDPR